jgi:hypothetical protein
VEPVVYGATGGDPRSGWRGVRTPWAYRLPERQRRVARYQRAGYLSLARVTSRGEARAAVVAPWQDSNLQPAV